MGRSRTILIVDDEVLNLKLLEIRLLSQRYRILKASSGEEALKTAREGPDLILLDITMPDMDGLETCRRLKENEATREIPVIFLSAFHSPETKAKALETGGVDFVSKPFDAQELLARVKTHLALREHQIQLKEYAGRLEEMVEERTRQLIHADRLATVGTFAASIAHEICNPVTYVDGNTQLAQQTLDSLRQTIENWDGTGTKRMMDMIDDVTGSLTHINEGNQRISRLITSLRTYGRGNEPRMEKCRVMDIIKEALILLNHRIKYGVSVETEVAQGLEIECNRQKICQVFVNLLNNAMDAMGPGNGKILIRGRSLAQEAKIEIKDNGPGIPKEIGNQIFEPFFTTKPTEEGTGLGLFIVRSIIEEHQGQISLAPYDGNGAEFNIVLPAPDLLQNQQ